MLEVTLPAGRYWIGDPCQVLTDERYDQLFSEQCEPRMRTVDGQQICLSHVSNGDGFYDCEIGTAAVDSGQIGILPYEMAEKSSNPEMSGVVIESLEPVSVRLDDGVHEFSYADTDGPMTISFGYGDFD